MHFNSFGHPFYQYEIAIEKRLQGKRTIFVCPNDYEHNSVLEFIRKDFRVILLNRRLINFLIKIGLKQSYVIDHKLDYSYLLNRKSSGKSPKFFKKKYISKDVCIFTRVKIQPNNNPYNLNYTSSERDFDKDYLAECENIIKQNNFSFKYGFNGFEKKSNQKKEKNNFHTIDDIAKSRIFFGTNTGPYVCAMSLRKPAFLINVIPFLGTHSYHKTFDWHMPILIKDKKSNKFLNLNQIIKYDLYLCNDENISEKGFAFERLPQKIVAKSFDEFIKAYKIGLKEYRPTNLQLKIRKFIEYNTDLGQVPYFPDSYLKELKHIFNI
tara:strand:- start:7986 stop:8954 length:969 start_codon:yes stop_codon:yes gene_type:complete